MLQAISGRRGVQKYQKVDNPEQILELEDHVDAQNDQENAETLEPGDASEILEKNEEEKCCQLTICDKICLSIIFIQIVIFIRYLSVLSEKPSSNDDLNASVPTSAPTYWHNSDQLLSSSTSEIASTTVSHSTHHSDGTLSTTTTFSASTTNISEICPDNGITNWKGDGFGAQYESLMSVYLHAQLINRPFCHTVWFIMAHGTNATDMFHFIGGDKYGPRANKDTKYIGEQTRHWGQRENMQKSLDTWAFARKAYYSVPKPELIWFSPEHYNIALHVRRGDVARHRVKFKQRWRSNNAYIKCMASLTDHYAEIGKPLKFHLFSEGNQSDFQSITDAFPETELHLDEDLKLTFHHMVSADALVTAVSSFSKTAGFINSGDVYFIEGRNYKNWGWLGCKYVDQKSRRSMLWGWLSHTFSSLFHFPD